MLDLHGGLVGGRSSCGSIFMLDLHHSFRTVGQACGIDSEWWDGVTRGISGGGTREVGFEASFSRAAKASLHLWASWGWCINFEPFRGGTREVGEVAHFVVEAHNIGVCGVSDL